MYTDWIITTCTVETGSLNGSKNPNSFIKVPVYSLNCNVAQHCDTPGYQPSLMIMESSETSLHQTNDPAIYFSRQGLSLIVRISQGSITALAIEHFSLVRNWTLLLISNIQSSFSWFQMFAGNPLKPIPPVCHINSEDSLLENCSICLSLKQLQTDGVSFQYQSTKFNAFTKNRHFQSWQGKKKGLLI